MNETRKEEVQIKGPLRLEQSLGRKRRMGSCMQRVVSVVLMTYIVIVGHALATLPAHPYRAFFIFGDSLVDVGNNNYIFSLANADRLPFGIDFPSGPTGRFCNGKIVPDFISELITLPYPPPYLAPTTRGKALLQGVSYASAAAGILRGTGANFLGRADFDTQISWFANSIQELQKLLGTTSATQELLAKSLFSVTIGANDYINNYLLPGSPDSKQYTPEQFQQVLLEKLSTQLKQLYTMGARTITVTNIGPIGCIPSQLAQRSTNGECSIFVNDLAMKFDKAVEPILKQLSEELGAKFVALDGYTPIFAFRSNPSNYGFKYGAEACCGAGRFKGLLLCLPNLKPCPDRSEYVFWDAFHPTESVNRQIANKFYETLSFLIE